MSKIPRKNRYALPITEFSSLMSFEMLLQNLTTKGTKDTKKRRAFPFVSFVPFVVKIPVL